MRTLGRWLSILLVGAALGAGSLWYAAFRMAPAETIAVGAWRMNPLAGSVGVDPYTRLRIALTSILALNRSETIYFEALADEEGRPLEARCDYTLTGPPPDARWWSVTAYGPDDMLIASPSRRYSASAASAAPDPDGQVVIELTRDGEGRNGVATGDGRFILLLRLYQPARALAEAPEGAPLFKLARGECRS